MRENKETARKSIEFVGIAIQKVFRTISIGLSPRQWIAALVICLLLGPIFSLPVQGRTYRISSPSNARFEPVNANLWFWENVYRTLSSRYEEVITPQRQANLLHDDIVLGKANGIPEDESDTDESKKKASDGNKEKKGTVRKGKKGIQKQDESEIGPNSGQVELSNNSDPTNEPGGEAVPVEGSVLNEDARFEVNSLEPVVPSRAAPIVNQIPEEEYDSVFSAENNLGSPFGQVEKDSSNTAAAIPIKHRTGIANFSFGLALASLSGRQLDANIGLTYNSRTWNKSVIDANTNRFTYDVEESWIAPGFSTGFGYFMSQNHTRNIVMMDGSNTYVDTYNEIVPRGLIDSDGTRHQIDCKTFSQIPGGHVSAQYCSEYVTSDGSFVKVIRSNFGVVGGTVNHSQTSFTVIYPDGSKVYFAGAFGSDALKKHYPIVIQDNNGNQIRVAYKTNGTGQIDYVNDTLNRRIKFYYGTDAAGNSEKLVAITIPGLNSGEEIQTVRFYYENLTLDTTDIFDGEIAAPVIPIQVLKYVYIPTTNTGFKYDYHSNYGMIKKISRHEGMSVSDAAILTTTGTVSVDGAEAASTEYDYPTGSPALTDVPKYMKRTDDWQGRTSLNLMETFYADSVPTSGQKKSTITVLENGYKVVTETVTHDDGTWRSGLVKSTSISEYSLSNSFSEEMTSTEYFWTQGQSGAIGRRNPVLEKIEITNQAQLTKKIEYDYDQYNNLTETREYGFAPSSTLMRTTRVGYETGTQWLNKNILKLPNSVERIVNGITVARSTYEYDGAAAARLPSISTATHDTYYNPDYPARTETVCPDGEDPAQSALPNGCVTINYPGYDANSIYRGNVTKIKEYADAVQSLKPKITDIQYDIAGNIVQTSLSCCQVRTIEYDLANEYAFPIEQTSGSSPTQLSIQATYNRNTGLMLTSTDENNRITNYEHETDTLRLKKVIYPNTGYVKTEYGDKLAPGVLPGFVRTTTNLDSTKTVQRYSYFNGRGLIVRSADETPDGWAISAFEFDHLGRPFKNYNPFYDLNAPNGTIPAGTKFTQVTGYDALGRATSVTLQDATTVSSSFSDVGSTPPSFDKTFVTITDQAGKQARQLTDALGRLVRVDEPDTNGVLGVVDLPKQPTTYEYDGNDNLAKVIQTDGSIVQERVFKYDSLSLRTHERQVEANPTLDVNGEKQTSGGLWTKVMKYDDDGRLVEGVDANGVKTLFNYDTLNRVKSVSFLGELGYETPTVSYTYDEARTGFFNIGGLTRVTTAANTGEQATPSTEQILDYDEMGRIVKHEQKIDSQAYLIEYGYNLAGQLISEKYPSGRIVSFGQDANGRMSSITDEARSFLNGVEFNSLTLSSQLNLGNGNVQSFGFNDRLQLISQSLTRGAEVVQKYDYGYGEIDGNGNLDTTKNSGQVARIESHIGTEKQWTQKLKYDSIGRLSEASEYRGDTNALSYEQKFDFDNFGNLYRKASSNPGNGENHIAFETIESGDIDQASNRFKSSSGILYDDAGQAVSDDKFRDADFEYDANGRLVRTVRSQIPEAQTVYDAVGRRVAAKVQDLWQFSIYDAFGRLIAEYGGTPENEGGVNYVHSNRQGSVSTVTNSAGFAQSRMDYQVFGGEIQSGVGLRSAAQGYGGNSTAGRGYALTEQDKGSGLDHTWFRKLENQAGRWTTPDPYSGSMTPDNPQSFNRYSYVNNQPTNFIDPTGLLLQVVCRMWTWVIDGGPRDGEEVGPRFWVCVVTGTAGGRAWTDQEMFDRNFLAGGGYTNLTPKNDPKGAQRAALEECLRGKVNGQGGINEQVRNKVNNALRNANISLAAADAVLATALLISFASLNPFPLIAAMIVFVIAVTVIAAKFMSDMVAIEQEAKTQTRAAYRECAKSVGITLTDGKNGAAL